MILGDKGVPDVLPALAHKKANELRMDDYFLWPSVGDHRQRLQKAVEAWLRSHPDCCHANVFQRCGHSPDLPTIHGVLAAIDVGRRHQGTIV